MSKTQIKVPAENQKPQKKLSKADLMKVKGGLMARGKCSPC